jgi:glycosyltransferase involved in cell wall biosynthesis
MDETFSIPKSRQAGGNEIQGLSPGSQGQGNPVVSIITAVRNGALCLERTIQSVLSQSYSPIEYIIIDGGSTDGTIDVIRRYDDKISSWVSEPDNGISDAFNKGIAAAHGEFVALLNADDWLSEDQIAQGVRALQSFSADYVYGDLLFHDENGVILYRINGDPDYGRIIRSKMPELCHPTVLARRSVYERFGLFDTRYRYAMDYEWALRLHVQGAQGKYVKEIVGHMGLGGASDASFRQAIREVRDIAIQYGRSRIIAEIEYRYRIIKGTTRRMLERSVPNALFDRLRNLFNPRYAGKVK